MPAMSEKAFPAASLTCLYLIVQNWGMWPLQTMRKSEKVIILTGHFATLNEFRLQLERKRG